ncbi:hypothetical protein M1D51_02595 [Arthrobacter sp. R3-55]
MKTKTGDRGELPWQRRLQPKAPAIPQYIRATGFWPKVRLGLAALTVVAAGAVAVAPAVSAQFQPEGPPALSVGDTQSEGSAAGEGPGENDPGDLVCQGNKVPVQALVNPKPASELSSGAAPALEGRDVSDFNPHTWLIAQESSDRVMLMTKLQTPQDDGSGDIRDYQYIIISTKSMESEPGKAVWAVVESSTCTLEWDLGGLDTAAVTLDPAQPRSLASNHLALLVTEISCNSGQDAEGRLEVAQLVETASTVEVVVGVRPSGAGMKTCQGNPPTPLTILLKQPLGDRKVLNTAPFQPREIAVPAARELPDGAAAAGAPAAQGGSAGRVAGVPGPPAPVVQHSGW